MKPMALLPPLKEGMLQTFITLKNPSPLVGFEPTNLGFNGKNAKQ
jgi:hypothetical protein